MSRGRGGSGAEGYVIPWKGCVSFIVSLPGHFIYLFKGDPLPQLGGDGWFFCFLLVIKVKRMQRSGTEAIKTQLQPSKTKREITQK